MHYVVYLVTMELTSIIAEVLNEKIRFYQKVVSTCHERAVL
jgi:hypothetical protein